ncbi:hypothetical protein Pmar_PMAR005984 [Perkinsus marinus ATCC 50983]|uniref:Uncharacterized protein n=1 Tax=Perkinsus marinus (strain ATCC 50983 / TXsc) TaxID=423536 RepID=C5L9W6_PERM5|nr:hypothetical protein Pmar_PMAR005984 [Perkinsus marinus ATCC 50983]EER06222.1 hypothetical protein Pmar_PMAR005984 [Perkinsus marinus ATCC 50983]|eukprot:XP_002774406.1 hypothetical protein Pmar_PMAR005984 [Perkinsus marinus ATCC 50983]
MSVENHPEWQGSRPAKWMDRNTGKNNSRKIIPTVCRSGEQDTFTRLGMDRFSLGFFKEGGLIPGAGFIRGMYPRTAPLNSVCWESFRAERPDLVQKRLPFREVDRLAEQQAAKGSVEELGEWERNILREIPGANYAEILIV